MSLLSTTITSCHNKLQDLGRRIEKVTKKRGFKEFVERGKWILRKEEHQEMIASLHLKSIDESAREAKEKARKLQNIVQLLAPMSSMSQEISDIGA